MTTYHICYRLNGKVLGQTFIGRSRGNAIRNLHSTYPGAVAVSVVAE